MNELKGRRVAILVADGFEQVEMTEPRRALTECGAETTLISPSRDKVSAWNHTGWGDKFPVDRHLDEVKPSDYDALLVPGGVMSPDRLRMNDTAVRFVRAFFDAGKPIASICHGPWMLIEADISRNRRLAA